ncbi:WSCD family member CG9164 [Geodia barretti]|uniref:WSCD family member CG9164 n=1 Tax=Geodia barretti TaxID=519541 RepID=A0AA35WLM2_GEOBA|nr:WSCD family member CG9164 [Geodia barretti]
MKTHNLKVQFVGGHVFSNTRVPYGAAILLVRDPRGALVAEWNRERSKRMISPNVSNHFTYVGEEYFGDNEMWEKYIHLKLPRWPQQMVNLLLEAKSAERPVYVLIFEDLKKNTVGEMKRVSDFLGFSLTEAEVGERLRVGFSNFYRNHTSTFTHFTLRQERFVSNVVGTTSQFMKDNGIYDMFPRIDEYL